jgi:putative tricarboxylic transport membrane protein
MIDFTAAADAIALLTTSWGPWIVVPPGIIIGLVFGAIPGLSIGIAMAIFLPVTLYMDFLMAMLFLTSIFTGGTFGSAIPAILMNIPGAAAAVATTFDGYPMAQQGKHNEALGLALASSCFGTALGYTLLLLLIEPIARAVLKLGPTEMFVVAVWGITLIAALSGGNIVRGLLAGTFGLLLGTVGMSARGDIRGTLDSPYLLDGFPIVPALIGMFAAAELFNLGSKRYIVKDVEMRRLDFGRILNGFRIAARHPWILVRGSLIGILIGAVPGVGAAVANMVSYVETRRRADDSETFGSGNPKGVMAAESANSSSEGGSMATLLALGIPGGGATAIMLGAFAMHDITGGPRFISDHKDIVYAIIFSNLAQTVLLVFIGLGFIFLSSALVKVPTRILVPTVLSLATLGAFSLTGNLVGPVTLACFAALGWMMRRCDYPVAATVIGLLLGRMAEGELLRSYQISGGEFEYLLGRPVTMVLLGLIALSMFSPAIKRKLQGRAAARQR